LFEDVMECFEVGSEEERIDVVIELATAAQESVRLGADVALS
jgi:hypothetical protein